MSEKQTLFASFALAVLILVTLSAGRGFADEQVTAALEKIGIQKGVCAVLGLPKADQPGFVVDLAKASKLLVYFQSPSAAEVAAVRSAAEAQNLLGTRVFADRGDLGSIHLADNLADAVIAGREPVGKQEILRVLHPEGKAILGGAEIVKPFPKGIDDWSHPYHGPDNNPQSTDRLARAPYLTQFMARPMFCPMPEVSVAAGGRIYRAFGHIAHKANQNRWLNTLLCINIYNGTILWQRKLSEGFMIHRNTMIATPEHLYLGDNESCKRIDACSGKVIEEIVSPVSDGPVWKWMALEDGVLYAMVGCGETPIATRPSQTPGMGHWPWGMWAGHDYKDPKTSFAFGHTLVAVDPDTKKILWTHRERGYLDGRGVCMKGGRIYFYSPEKFLGCLDAKAGKVLWKTSQGDLLAAIGPNGRAQHYVTGYSTTTYIKCNEKYVFFAGPQRSRLVVVSAEDGKLLWKKDNGNLQLVLQDDGFYAAGPGQIGCKMAYEDGRVLARLPGRRACTRATGSVDSVFYRATGGTVRVETASNTARHIVPMRPPCQDGVIISSGILSWGPWMCGCQLSLYGHICLAPAGQFDFRPGVDDSRVEYGPADTRSVEPLEVRPGDWPAYLGNSRRTMVARAAIPRKVKLQWTAPTSAAEMPTAPVTAGEAVFVGDRTGVLRCLGAADGKLRWKARTGGAIYFPPAIAEGRLYAGSADGWIYALEAASGRPLWRFRAAPAQRWIPVYGKLISTWPVAGGVVVDSGVVYAAAGIAHYDGTHVYALDAITGKLKWYNDNSGSLSEKTDSGASLQGNLYLCKGELRFTAGGACETARYDLRSGKCLSGPNDVVSSQFHTAFYPYYPDYANYLSLEHVFADGRRLVYDASYEGSLHSNLALLAPLPPGTPEIFKRVSRWPLPKRLRGKVKVLWRDKTARRFNAFVVTDDLLLAAAELSSGGATRALLAAIDVNNGSEIWLKRLPAAVVKGGLAVSHEGQIVVALENGQVLCFAGE